MNGALSPAGATVFATARLAAEYSYGYTADEIHAAVVAASVELAGESAEVIHRDLYDIALLRLLGDGQP